MSDGRPADGGGSTTIPTADVSQFSTTPGSQSTVPDFSTIVPESFKNEEWVKNIQSAEKPHEELFNQFANLQKKIGEKATGLQKPGEGATPEQIQAWNKAIGVPDSEDGYEIKPIEWSKEEEEAGKFLESTRDENFMKSMKAEAKKLGVPKETFEKLAEAYDRTFVASHKEALAAQAQAVASWEADFEKMTGDVFGDAKEAVLAKSKEMLPKYVPEAVKPWLKEWQGMETVPVNQAFTVIASIMNQVRAMHLNEDGTGSGSFAAQSAGDIRAQAIKLMQSEAYTNPMDPRHAEVKQSVKDLYKRLPVS